MEEVNDAREDTADAILFRWYVLNQGAHDSLDEEGLETLKLAIMQVLEDERLDRP